MPANLPPDYHKAEERYRAAESADEKIAALEEMLRIMPKHKGTDKLQADLKARIAKLRRQPAKKGARAAFSHMIPREGAGQVALVGPPNSGKSSLVAILTHASPETADYPFTTRTATPGMMPFEDIAFQLIDLPPVSPEFVEPWVWDLVRRADLVWVVLDGDSPLTQWEEARGLLEARHIRLRPAGRGGRGEESEAGLVVHPALLIVTGRDRPGVPENVRVLDELLEGRWPMVAVSCRNGQGLEDLRRRTFEVLDIIRVYTKQPGKSADRDEPFTLPRGATVGDLAARIHKDLAATMRFARVWGASAFDGQAVQQEHVLAEGDVVELHT